MDKFVRGAVLWAVLLALPVQAVAVKNPSYANTVIVAKSGGNFTEVIAAVNSITGASAANPYLVKVMPGVYDLGSVSLQMKEYVYLEGSGEDNTIITSAVLTDDAVAECTLGTIIMANNSSLKNIKVVNTALNGDFTKIAYGVAFKNVEAEAEGVKVLVGTDGAYIYKNVGVCSGGTSGHAILKNVNIEARNVGGNRAKGVQTSDNGRLTVLNSKVVAISNGSSGNAQGIRITGPAVISDSYIEGTMLEPAAGESVAVQQNAGKLAIYNSRLHATNGNDVRGINIYSNDDVSIINAQIYLAPSPGATVVKSIAFNLNTPILKVTNSLLWGGFSDSNVNARFFNNYDENALPIPNIPIPTP
jgi:pectin methylesterase-like acyl-CoA thioesterase